MERKRKMEKANMKEAIRLLGVYTAGRFEPWDLAGDSKATCRTHVMSLLLGRKATVRESGVSALRATFYNLLNITGSCEADRHANFAKYCRSVLSDASPLHLRKEEVLKKADQVLGETAQVILQDRRVTAMAEKVLSKRKDYWDSLKPEDRRRITALSRSSELSPIDLAWTNRKEQAPVIVMAKKAATNGTIGRDKKDPNHRLAVAIFGKAKVREMFVDADIQQKILAATEEKNRLLKILSRQ
jgi:hypothetical protein